MSNSSGDTLGFTCSTALSLPLPFGGDPRRGGDGKTCSVDFDGLGKYPKLLEDPAALGEPRMRGLKRPFFDGVSRLRLTKFSNGFCEEAEATGVDGNDIGWGFRSGGGSVGVWSDGGTNDVAPVTILGKGGVDDLRVRNPGAKGDDLADC